MRRTGTGDPDGAPGFDTDWIVIGSGFGGSVSALRLAERGWDVTVLECGRRFADDEFAKSTWDLRNYFWAPLLGLRGILRLSLFRDAFMLSGCGVGGGSLGYANTLYRPRDDQFYGDPQWAELADWKTELEPHYAMAEHMLGVDTYHPEGAADRLLRRLGHELDVEHTFSLTRVGVYLGASGIEVDDPYFGGAGPARTGCTRCGSCMVGCRVGAKNTLMKNYLWFAERAGVRIQPEREVIDIEPLGDIGDGSEGWAVHTERPGAWIRRDPRTLTARHGVIVAAGALGSTRLLLQAKLRGSLHGLSDRVGELVRTNSESILGVTAPDDTHDFANSVAISSSIHPNPNTHVEVVTYGGGGGAIGMLSTLLVGDGTRVTRPWKFLGQALRHPVRLARITWPRRWSRRSFLVLVMQSHDNAISLRGRRRLLRRRIKLRTVQDARRPSPTFIPEANDATERLASYLGGTPQSSVMEALFNIPTTAHVLGGCAIGSDALNGVVDAQHRAFGYRNLYVIDGSSVPANLGVNPSLTITAMAERAASQFPVKPAANP